MGVAYSSFVKEDVGVYTVSSFKTNKFSVDRSSIPLNQIDTVLPFENVVFQVSLFQQSQAGFCQETNLHFSKVVIRYTKKLEEATDKKMIHAKLFIIRKLFNEVISIFDTMSVFWRYYFENHYIIAIHANNALKEKRDKYSERTLKVLHKFMDMAEKYMIQNMSFAFQLPPDYFEYFIQKYPKESYSYGYKKSRNHWLSVETANMVGTTCNNIKYNYESRLVSRIFSKIFPQDICEFIHGYAFTPLTITGKSFIEFFSDIYDYTNECVKPEFNKIAKSITLRRNYGAVSVAETFNVKIHDYRI
jgi:hypothetical protein